MAYAWVTKAGAVFGLLQVGEALYRALMSLESPAVPGEGIFEVLNRIELRLFELKTGILDPTTGVPARIQENTLATRGPLDKNLVTTLEELFIGWAPDGLGGYFLMPRETGNLPAFVAGLATGSGDALVATAIDEFAAAFELSAEDHAERAATALELVATELGLMRALYEGTSPAPIDYDRWFTEGGASPTRNIWDLVAMVGDAIRLTP